jgi:hypothetical protein
MAHIVCNIGAVTFLMTTRPPSLDRRVFFRRRISNDSLIVDLVSVALSSDGPAAVLARRPREQPAARPGTKGGAKGARGGGGRERGKGDGEEAPVWHCRVFRAAPYNNAVLLCRLYSPPCFPRCFPLRERRPTLSSLFALPRWHLLVYLLTRSVDTSSLAREGKFICASPGIIPGTGATNERARMTVIQVSRLLPLIDFRVKRASWPRTPYPISRGYYTRGPRG